MLVYEQHKQVILWYKDDETVEEIPVIYYDGSFWDKDMNEYTFPETNREYWDNFFKDQRVRRVIVPSFDEDGNLKKNHLDNTMYEWRFVPYDTPKEVRDAVMFSRPTKERWEKEVWNPSMAYSHKQRTDERSKDEF